MYRWVKASGITGKKDKNFSIYTDIHYTDGTPYWGPNIQVWILNGRLTMAKLPVGTYGWTYFEKIIITSKPVNYLIFSLLLKTSHQGKAWFSNVTLSEVQGQVYLSEISLILGHLLRLPCSSICQQLSPKFGN